ncbi:leishmanolysin-like peptidase [Rana temporaria]|uniref:leishmanolysin-like peptidase n=1 Tax=Rana temporaria TaxID=8407 RepID=UPI001AADCF64|nr:leishmanolysin-like peptidase [Rana temporaria]
MIHYDTSIDHLEVMKKRLVKNKLFPQAISYLQKTFQVRRPSSSILLSRQCANNQYLKKKSDPHRYCHGACAQHTRCGPVIVPEEHLQVIESLLFPHNPHARVVGEEALVLINMRIWTST